MTSKTLPLAPSASLTSGATASSASVDINADDKPTSGDLSLAIRASLNAKLVRLLSRPFIARIVRDEDEATRGDAVARPEDEGTVVEPEPAGDANPSWVVKVEVDYDCAWRDREKEVADAFDGAVETHVALLSDEERVLLEHSAEEFLALEPRPPTAELSKVGKERSGRRTRIVEVTLATAAVLNRNAKHVAIVPNLAQLERQLDALAIVEAAEDGGPLGPLRALIGIGGATLAASVTPPLLQRASHETLDEHQMRCVSNALATPHFAVIEGPPGSGKTTVISAIVRRALERGERVLIVSPTNVAVNNVVEKLRAQPPHDVLEPHTLPIRYSSSATKTGGAVEYWVGPNEQQRARTIQRRVKDRLCAKYPFAAALYAAADNDGSPGPLSAALIRVASVLCGTPLGVLSYGDLKKSGARAPFDLLIVDEVSKLTLPEFLAVAVKAERWVLVGDPQQLPPHSGADDNASALDDLIPSGVELACSVAALASKERCPPRLIVVACDPLSSAMRIRARLEELAPRLLPLVTALTTLTDGGHTRIVVCKQDELDAARARLSTSSADEGDIVLITERGLPWRRPPPAGSGVRVVAERDRAQSLVFSTCYDTYHSLPWSVRSERPLRHLSGAPTARVMPSAAMMASSVGRDETDHAYADFTLAIAERVAVNMVSVYDWVTGLPAGFEQPPLREIQALDRVSLAGAVLPFVGTLKRQYRMAPELSAVPRKLFYFDEALYDGGDRIGGVIHLVRVNGSAPRNLTEEAVFDDGETNLSELDEVERLLQHLNRYDRMREPEPPTVMIITPYSAQRDRAEELCADMQRRRLVDGLALEVCTLDSCQGREADVVIISLVKRHTTTFLDNPKRWNVALTRAKKALYLVGDIAAFLDEARGRRRQGVPENRPVSVVARVIDAYQRQLAATRPKVQR